jgi:hypothetical protein
MVFFSLQGASRSKFSVEDPHHLDVDPDADPDSIYHPDADPVGDPDSDFYLMQMRIRIWILASK